MRLLKVTATIEFPDGYLDNSVLRTYKRTVASALRDEHAQQFRPDWPAEITVKSEWEERP